MPWTFWSHYLIALAVVALVLGGLFACARVLARRRVFGPTHRLVTIVESTMLSGQLFVHVVKIADRYILIGAANANVTTLAELPADAVDAWLAQRRRNRPQRPEP